MTMPGSSGIRFAVELDRLSKRYAGMQAPALDSVCLEIPKGSVFALLGPNGAGKSTLINILAGLVKKDSGRVVMGGYDLDQDSRSARNCIGVVLQELFFDPYFTPRQAMELQAGLYGVPQSSRNTDLLLKALGLSDKANAHTRSLSGGMKRRLMIARALVHDPDIVVLDEPTAGVDVELRRRLWSLIRAMNEYGKTVILTTHYIEEAQQMCDHVAIVNGGKVIACDRTDALLDNVTERQVRVTWSKTLDALPPQLKAYEAVLDESGRQLTIMLAKGDSSLGSVLELLRDVPAEIVDMVIEAPKLEDVFLSLTGDVASVATVDA